MGRVFEAIKRANASNKDGVHKRQQPNLGRREESTRVPGLSSTRQVEEHTPGRSSSLSVSQDTAQNSASTAHTADVTGGMALPGGMASRDVGATLDAAEATRGGGFASYDISPARVEPHLVAVSQPRSPYCEQFRSLRTKLLEAGEQKEMRAFVVTSAGVGEGKTLTALNLAWLLAQTEGMRALVIDSDLRQPCATDYLGIETSTGLSDVLGGKIGRASCRERVWVTGGGRSGDEEDG